HHFTNPVWLAKAGGWEKKRSASYFKRYCDFVVRALAKHVRYWITINEPTIYISHAYLFGAWPPQKKSLLQARAVEGNLLLGHVKAYRLIHNIYKELKLVKPFVGISQYTQAFVPCAQDAKSRFAASLRNKLFKLGFLDAIARHKAMDFVGVNYYSRQLVHLKNWGAANFLTDVCDRNHHPVKKNSLGWDIYPEGLGDVLLKLKPYALPVIITENGICTRDDGERWDYIRAHLKSIHLALEKGVNVRGYLYWSLIDNFEWDKGFGPRFGLIDVDYNTYKRTVRQSADLFARVCKTGILEE
ncbi:MAG: family 1 glycosylhydrolase, partial [Candidatus Omnitrophica bacterium]|nr:family 1 glycosylhydrolase [Candidatus Omnitrophota bacterium]